MKAFISCDIEGVSGVASPDLTRRTDYGVPGPHDGRSERCHKGALEGRGD